MAINLKLATISVKGVTDFNTRVFSVADNNAIVDIDSVNALFDGGVIGGDFSLRLPQTPLPADVVEFKNLLSLSSNTVLFPANALQGVRFTLPNQQFAGVGNVFLGFARGPEADLIVPGNILRVGGEDYEVLTVNLGRNVVLLLNRRLVAAVNQNDPIDIVANNDTIRIIQGTQTERIFITQGQFQYGTTLRYDPNAPATFIGNITGAVMGALINPTAPTVTIDRNGHNIDGLVTDITTSTANQVFRLVYINENIGWAAI